VESLVDSAQVCSYLGVSALPDTARIIPARLFTRRREPATEVKDERNADRGDRSESDTGNHPRRKPTGSNHGHARSNAAGGMNLSEPITSRR
jgi:hypothetical protein